MASGRGCRIFYSKDSDCSHKIKRCLLLERKAMTDLDSVLKNKDITLLTKVHRVKAMVFPVVMYGCKNWTVKKAECQRTDAFKLWRWRRLESLLDSKEIKPVNPKGNQPWIFIVRTDAEAEAPILWSPDAKSQFIGKDPDAGKDWGQEEKRVAEDEIVGWHHWLNGHEWANSSRWWRTGKHGMLYSTGSQIVGHNLATEQQLKVLVKSVLRVTG